MKFSQPRRSQPLQRNFSLVSPATADVLKKVLKGIDIYQGHNKYSDLRNIWAPSAHYKKDKLTQRLRYVGVGALVFLLSVVMWAWCSSSNVHVKVVEVLQPVYVNDNAQLINYAADFNGAKVVSSTAPYHAILSNLSNYNDVGHLLTDSTDPGSCWAFDGAQGFVEIQLAHPVQVTKFSMKHRNVRPTQSLKYSNAPHHFTVYGDSLFLDQCVHLGSYSFIFDIEGDARKTTQVFDCKSSE